MSKIQTVNLVFKVSTSIYLLVMSLSGFGADTGALLSRADSLFENNKYTESFDVYDVILEAGNYTPSMLLKMAFIKEGLGDVSGALYYLNLYYNQTSNKKVLSKLEKIASENQLIGYEFSDADFFLNLFHRYNIQVFILIGTLSIFLLAWQYRHWQKFKTRSVSILTGQILALVLLFLLINYGSNFQKGIIVDPQTYLMTGPSGGADVIGIIEKGHRVEVLSHDGIWVKIRWENQEVYVRNNKIKTLS